MTKPCCLQDLSSPTRDGTPALGNVLLALPLSYPPPLTQPPVHVQTCLPRHALWQGLLPSPARPDPQSSLEPSGDAGRCCPLPGCRDLGKKCFLALAGPGFPGCAPRGPQGGLAQGPSLLSDFDKPIPSVPHPHWVGSGASRTSALRLQGDFSPLGRMSKCRCPAHRGGSGLAGLGRAQKSAF